MTGPAIASRVVGTIRMRAESHRGRVVRKNVIIDLSKTEGKQIFPVYHRNGHSATAARFMGTLPSTTLADLFTLLFAANPFSAARASLWRWSSDEFEDGLAHGGQCRSRRRPVDSFFPALLF